jgi:hypothetical protein
VVKHHNLKVIAKTAWSAAGLMAVADPQFRGTVALHSPHLDGKFFVGGSRRISLDRSDMNDYLIKMGLSQNAIDDILYSEGDRWVKVTNADIKK